MSSSRSIEASSARSPADQRLCPPCVLFRLELAPEGAFRLRHMEGPAERILGMSVSDALRDARALLSRIHPDDRPALAEALRSSALGAPSEPMRIRVAAPASEAHHAPRVVTWNCVRFGDHTHWDGAIVESSEPSLPRSEQSFRVLIESSPDAVLVHRAGRLLYVNQPGAHILGYDDPAALQGSPLLDLVVAEERDAYAAAMREVAERGDKVTREQHLRSRSGHAVALELTTGPIAFAGDRALMTIGRDITVRKQIQAQMLQTDRLASLGTMASGMAHEINNPLAYITANLTFVAEELQRLTPKHPAAEWAEMRDAIAESRDGVGRVRDIVRQLRRFSRVDDEPAKRLDLCDALDGAVRMALREIKGRARLEVECPFPADVRANEAQLAQVFLHLLANAAQSVADSDARERLVRLRMRASEPGVEVAVSDTGSGMPPEVAAKIFDPFFTTKPVGSGTGLGLAVSHSIITGLGGTISVDSKADEGTTFTVSLPATTAPVTDRTAAVLVVEDEPSALDTIQSVLRGHALTYVWAAEQAIELARSRPYDAFVWAPSCTDHARHVYESLAPWPGDLATRTVVVAQNQNDADESALPFPVVSKPIDPHSLRKRLAPLLDDSRGGKGS